MAGHQGLCHPAASAAKTLCFWPPNLSVLIVSSSMEVSQEIWDCCTPCVLSETQLQARLRGLVGSAGLRFESCAN